MKHSYSLIGMSCAGCENTVKKLLSNVDGVTKVETSLAEHKVDIEMTKHVPIEQLQDALQEKSNYKIQEWVVM